MKKFIISIDFTGKSPFTYWQSEIVRCCPSRSSKPSGSATSTLNLTEIHSLLYRLPHFSEPADKYTLADKAALRPAHRLIHKLHHLHRQHNFQQPL